MKGWLPEILNNVPGADFLFRHHDEGTLDSGGDLPRNQVHIDITIIYSDSRDMANNPYLQVREWRYRALTRSLKNLMQKLSKFVRGST